MDSTEFRNQLLDIRKVLESFIEGYGNEQSLDFQNKLNTLNNEFEMIHDSLLTIINYFTLQQNAIRALLLIENVTREKNVKLQEIDNLTNALRMFILPQVETFLYNLKSAVKSKDRVIAYLEKSPIQSIPSIIQDMVEMDKKFLETIEQPDKGQSNNLLEQSLQSLLMARLESSKNQISKMLDHLQIPAQEADNVTNEL